MVFSGGLITEGLGLISPWLLPVALLVDAFLFEATSQCAVDPPAMPSANDLDIRNAIGGVFNPNFGGWITAVNNLLLNWAWDQFCTCSAGSPTAAVYPAAPTDTATPQTPRAVPCFSGDVTRQVAPAVAFHYLGRPANAGVMPSTGVIYVKNDVGFNFDYAELATVPTSGVLNVHATGLTIGQTYSMGMRYLDAAHNGVGTAFDLQYTAAAAVEDHTLPFTVPPLAAYAHCDLTRWDGTVGDTAVVHATATWYCGGGGPGVNVGPCADSPEVLNLLAQIHRLLTAVYNRQVQPIGSYIEGAVHSGLSGNGSVSLVAACIGVKVTITADTSGKGSHAGNPVYLFDRGFIVALAAEGPIRAPARLTFNPQLFQLPPPTDAIGYTLTAGVTVSITELLPGP